MFTKEPNANFGKYLDYSSKVIHSLNFAINKIEELAQFEDLCIYAAGAFGRREACEHSGLDLLFLKLGDDAVPRMSKILIDSGLIYCVNSMSIPSFSNDGEFMDINHLTDILPSTLSNSYDIGDGLMARVLLLTESTPVYNSIIFEEARHKILHWYSDSNGFNPFFLVSDIMRYWKGVYLSNANAHHLSKTDDWGYLCSIKLCFYKMLACYSIVFHIILSEGTLAIDKLLSVLELSPLERLWNLRTIDFGCSEAINQVSDIYKRYLSIFDRPISDLIEYNLNNENRIEIDNLFIVYRTSMMKILRSLMIKDSDLEKLIF